MEGAVPRLGSFLLLFVVMVCPWGSMWRLETDPAAFAAQNFPANSQGTSLEQDKGIPAGITWRIIQILLNTWIGSLLTFSQAAEEPWLCDHDLRE